MSNLDSKTIDKIYFSRGLVNVPKFSIVQDGQETPVFASAEALDKMKTDPTYKVVMSLSIELMRFGKILSPQAFYGVLNLGMTRQLELAENLKSYLKDLYMDGKYTTLFGDFPNTVLEMSEREMLVNQILHYWGSALGGEYWPSHMTEDTETRDESLESSLNACCKDKYDIFEASSADELADSISVLLKSQQSLTQIDKQTVASFYANIDALTLSPEKKLEMKTIDIPFKETLCIVASNCSDSQVVTEINDVLRIAMFMSGGDISLAPIPKIKDLGWKKVALGKEDKKAWNFKNFTNSETRLLLTSIENIVSTKKDDAIKDMKKYVGRWIRLGEKLHPASAKNVKRYPNAAAAFQIIRNASGEIKTFGSLLENAKQTRNLDQTLKLLSSRPGEFARHLDWLIRTFVEGQESPKPIKKENTVGTLGTAILNSGITFEKASVRNISKEDVAINKNKILRAFSSVVQNVSTKLLYELLEHFNKRDEVAISRKVVIKGARRPVDIPILMPLSEDSIKTIQAVVLKDLIRRMSEKEDLSGVTVYLEDKLENIMLPKNMRSTGEAVKQVARGTKMPLPEISKLLRLFLFWKDENGSEDLDLSVHFYNETFELESWISWNGNYKLYNVKTGAQYAQFSGDVRHHRGNCAEYVDIDIQKALEAGSRYVIAVARDFNANSFKTAFTGVMARAKWGTPGETSWAPSTVEQGFKVTADSQNVVLCIVDLKERQIINVDEDLAGRPMFGDSSSLNQYTDLLERYVNTKRFFNVLTLLETYFNACGAHVVVTDLEHIVAAKEQKDVYIFNQNEYLKDPEITDSRAEAIRASIENVKKSYRFLEFTDFSNDYSKIFEYMF